MHAFRSIENLSVVCSLKSICAKRILKACHLSLVCSMHSLSLVERSEDEEQLMFSSTMDTI